MESDLEARCTGVYSCENIILDAESCANIYMTCIGVYSCLNASAIGYACGWSLSDLTLNMYVR